MMSPVALKRPFPALIGPQGLRSNLRNLDFPVFIVLSRDVKIMSFVSSIAHGGSFSPVYLADWRDDSLHKQKGGGS